MTYHVVHPAYVLAHTPVTNTFNLEVIVSGTVGVIETMERRCWLSRLEAQSGEWLTGLRAGKRSPPSQKQTTKNRNL